MTDLKARKEGWPFGLEECARYIALKPKLSGGPECVKRMNAAARLIRLYEADRKAKRAAIIQLLGLLSVDEDGSKFIGSIDTVKREKEADAALNAAWAEILEGEGGE